MDKFRYDGMRVVILEILKSREPRSTSNLIEAVVEHVEANGKVEYSIGWCAMAVKLDLEAKSEICFDRSAKKASRFIAEFIAKIAATDRCQMVLHIQI